MKSRLKKISDCFFYIIMNILFFMYFENFSYNFFNENSFEFFYLSFFWLKIVWKIFFWIFAIKFRLKDFLIFFSQWRLAENWFFFFLKFRSKFFPLNFFPWKLVLKNFLDFVFFQFQLKIIFSRKIASRNCLWFFLIVSIV